MKPTGEIRLEDLPAKIRESAAAPGSDLGEFQGADLKAHLKAIEQTLIEQAMASAGGVTAKAARLLGMQRTTLVEKLSRNQA
jgi:sigma-54 specific flagellar transcriptional regulator A